MKEMTPNQKAFWDRFVASSPEPPPKDAWVEAGYCGNREMTDRLLQLYLSGKKYAGSGLVKDYETAGDPLPRVGNYWMILDSSDEPRCIVKTVRVVLNRFKDIGSDIALAEGEGDCSLDYWREAHRRFFTPYLQEWNIDDLNEAEVVTEFFNVVYREAAESLDSRG